MSEPVQAQLEYDGCIFPLQDPTWVGVLHAARKLNVHNVDEAAFYVTYHDEDDERVTVKCDQDVTEALMLTKELMRPCLALSVPFVGGDDDWVKDDFSASSHVRTPQPMLASGHEMLSATSVREEEQIMRATPQLRGYDDVVLNDRSTVSKTNAEPICEVNEEAEPTEKFDEQIVSAPKLLLFVENGDDDTPSASEPCDPQVRISPAQEMRSQSVPLPLTEAEQGNDTVEQEAEMFSAMARAFRCGIEGRSPCASSPPKSVAGAFRDALAESLSDRKSVDALVGLTRMPAFTDAIVASANLYRQGADATTIKASLVTTLGASFFKILVSAPELGSLLPFILERESVFGEVEKPTEVPAEEEKDIELVDDEPEEGSEDEPEEEPEEDQYTEPAVIHVNVKCDGCGMVNISGIRYKSAVVSDMDLCEDCEQGQAYEYQAGPFLKIRDPRKAPDAILCVLRGASRAPRENLDWRNPLANEFLEFVQNKSQRSFQTSRPVAPPPPVAVVVDSPPILAAEHVQMDQQHKPSAPPMTEQQAPAVVPASVAVSSSAAPVRAAHCRGNHVLGRFSTPHFGFSCNVCSQRQRAGSVMHGCRPCDFDVCSSCYDTYSVQGGVTRPSAAQALSAMSPVQPQAKFVSDVTMTDGCIVKPGENMIKTWRVRNSGTEAWPVGVRIAHVGGNSFGGPAAGVEVPRANPGEAVNVSVPLVMPVEPGRHTSYWRMITPHPANSKFGHRFWVTVNVVPQQVLDPIVPAFVEFARLAERPRPASANPPAPGNQSEGPIVESALELAVAQVTELGFADIDKIVRILREENGDASRTIDRLLNE